MSIPRSDRVKLFERNRTLAIRARSLNFRKETRECLITLTLVEQQIVLVPVIIPRPIEECRFPVWYAGDKNPFMMLSPVMGEKRQHEEGTWHKDQQASRYGWHTGGACWRREEESRRQAVSGG